MSPNESPPPSGSSIKALPTGTAKLLTATQVITTPLSCVKELLENALDARATSISIEISANTLDVIQVRDNGHGIAPDDRGMCCKRHTTSKLTEMSDLRDLGGETLGFRGEALFAIAQVAGAMSVTTRVEGEGPGAVKLDMGRDGEVVGRSTASHPVGTTMKVTDFFDKLPVRKQTALKDAPKSLASIGKMLQAYALARPYVRIMMKVLKANKPNSVGFTYASKAGDATVADAAYKLIGKHAVQECQWLDLDTEGGFRLRALLPSPDAVVARINNIGHFLSVDDRPVSTARGYFKKSTKLIVERMRKNHDALSTVKRPFFVLNIACPRGSYDPNVEPAKDDVIFDDERVVTKALEELLGAAYPEVRNDTHSGNTVPICGPIDVEAENAVPPNQPLAIPAQSLDHSLEEQDFDALDVEARRNEVRTPVAVMTVDQAEREEALARKNELDLLENRADIWQSSMYGVDEDDLPFLPDPEPDARVYEEEDSGPPDRRGLNPWTIAKLNAPVKPRVPGVNQMPRAPPRARSLSPAPSERVQMPASPQPRDDLDTRATAHSRQAHRRARSPELYSSARSLAQPAPGGYGLPTPQPSSSPGYTNKGQALVPPHVRKQRRLDRNRNYNNAFKPPSRVQNWDDEGPSGVPNPPRPSRSQNSKREGRDLRDMLGASNVAAQSVSLVSQGEPQVQVPSSDNMEDEFRARLRKAGEELSSQYASQAIGQAPAPACQAQHHPTAVSNSGWTPINADLAPARIDDQLAQVQQEQPQPQPLAKRRRTTTGGGKRSKSSKLPLERVPNGFEMQNVILNLEMPFHRLENIYGSFVPIMAGNEMDLEPLDELLDNLLENDSALEAACLNAIDLLRERLDETERVNDEDIGLALVGVLSRLERGGEAIEAI